MVQSSTKILVVSHFYEQHGGGIERVAGQINRQLRRLGAEVSWVASEGDEIEAGVAGELLPIRCLNFVERLTGLPMPIPFPASLAKLNKAVRRSDVIIIHDALYVTSVAAVMMGRRAKKPTILIQHVSTIPFSSRILRVLMRLLNRVVAVPLLRAADMVVFISRTTQDEFLQVRTKRSTLLLYNGVDTSVFYPGSAEERTASRLALGILPDTQVVLFVGRFVEKKGLSILRRVAAIRSDIQFVLAGKGPIDPEAWNLANVMVLRDRRGRTLAELYRAADLFVLPSVGEGYPLVVQEALASGLPVICGSDSARADPGASKWLTSVSVDLTKIEASADHVLDAMRAADQDTAARAAMAEYAATTYRWDTQAKRLFCTISDLVRH